MATIKEPLGCSTADAFFLFMDAKSSNHAFDKVQSSTLNTLDEVHGKFYNIMHHKSTSVTLFSGPSQIQKECGKDRVLQNTPQIVEYFMM